jgi:hypothetical protein
LLAKQDLDVGFVVDHKNKQAHVPPYISAKAMP